MIDWRSPRFASARETTTNKRFIYRRDGEELCVRTQSDLHEFQDYLSYECRKIYNPYKNEPIETHTVKEAERKLQLAVNEIVIDPPVHVSVALESYGRLQITMNHKYVNMPDIEPHQLPPKPLKTVECEHSFPENIDSIKSCPMCLAIRLIPNIDPLLFEAICELKRASDVASGEIYSDGEAALRFLVELLSKGKE